MIGIKLGLKGQQHILGDASVSAFLAATGITGTTQVNAITNLVANLKNYGLWSKMNAIYPFVSDTYNLLSYTEDFTNAAWQKANASITANTITSPDGTTTADTITDNSTSGLHQVQFPLTTTIGTYTISCYGKAGTLSYIGLYNNSSNKGKLFNLSNGTTAGNIVAAPTSATIESVGNGWYRCSITTTTLGSNSNWQILLSEDGVTFSYSGTGKNAYIWGAQLDAGTTATTYQPITTTPAARFVSQFKYNLKDSRDLDAAFRLTFNGAWTYTQNGATGNGTSTYISTYLNPSLVLTNNNLHFSYYSRTNIKENKQDVNASNGNPATSEIFLTNYGLATNTIYFTANIFVPNTASYVAADSLGYVIGNTTSSTLRNIFKAGTKVATDTSTNTTALPNINTNIGARANPIQEYSSKQFAFVTLGDGLTDTQALNLYTSVQAFQVELSRQV